MSAPPYMSNDHFIWTTDKPDAELIEPEILASIDKNLLIFSLKVQGVVFGRQLHALPFVRATNSTTITVYRRPTNAFKVDEDYPPRKDRLFIYLAPVFHWKTQPTSLFNHAMPYEKLRICLNYTAQSSYEGSNFSLQQERNGWNTWQSHIQKARD
ncbi:unnamed protein product [Cercopithifilaria johnstoni]|uniref:Uncharacterized protein n=1 Tax=Cercopithifilaria johnstoni TaxID=2874296 RepID=A0A8J2MTT0_9BILA|nr:unnamed protein product [Cercopithifilaria johnstoni]